MPFLKRKTKKSGPPPIKLCPNCYEPKLKVGTNVGGFMAPAVYYCEKCDYKGPLYIEVDVNENGEAMVDIEELKKQFPNDVDEESSIESFNVEGDLPPEINKKKK